MHELSVITVGSGPRLTGYDRALLPSIVDIFVLEHCYAAVATKSERRSKRRGVTSIPPLHVLTVPTINMGGWIFRAVG